MADAVLVGVDGGASKTRAAVVSSSGSILATASVRSSSAYHKEPEEAAAVVLAAAREALATSGVAEPIAALGAGLAGADDPAIRERLIGALTRANIARIVHVDHDAAAALAGGTALAPGVVIISGTGSIAFGVDEHGRRARAGGWGPLLDDEGSGYSIGRAVLRAAMRAHDGRGDSTLMAEAVRARFGIASLAALKATVRGASIDAVASVAPLAVEAADAGDPVAARILARAGEGLAVMVLAVARALGWEQNRFTLVASGGVLGEGGPMAGLMMRALDARACTAVLTPARFPPEIGAALLAAQAAGMETAWRERGDRDGTT
ncbi:MAG: BadF/BadG/BcrA/BcrD ATPase family protein [bacterium]|nr:BadF/BadG/BcrA/BcrD ATPase family protein [bacterium]